MAGYIAVHWFAATKLVLEVEQHRLQCFDAVGWALGRASGL